MAARQHGVVSHAQLLDAGLTRDAVDRRVAAGWLHRVHRGVFSVGHPGTDRSRAVGGRRVLRWRRRGAAGVQTHAGRLRPGDTVVVDGIRVTKVARALLDLAEIVTLEDLVRAIDQATANRQLRPHLMSSVISTSRGRRGLKPLRQALLITRPQDVLTRSELERRALRLIGRAGLPRPEVNTRLAGYEVDLLWRAAELVVELDGSEYHDPERDTRKTNDLVARGFTVLRFTWRQVVNDPAWVVGALQAVRSRAACPASPSSSA